MANEIEEFNRYWSDVLGVFTYPKSGERRAGVFAQLTYGGPESVRDRIPDSAVAHFRIRTANGSWTSRTSPYSMFKQTFQFVPHKSKFVNVDPFAVYVHHSVKRQFAKGVTEGAFDGSICLREAHLDLQALWLGKPNTARKAPPKWWDVSKEYFSPYPSGTEAIHEAFSGRRFGVAFSPHLAIINTADIKHPILYYRVHQAGVFERPNFLVIDTQYSELARILGRLLPGVGVKFHNFKEKAHEYR